MKKILILIVLLTAYSNIFAFLTQANWRWRNDDGSETSATWKAAQNTAVTLTAINEVIRLRLEVYNNQNGNPIGLLDTLQYSTSVAGPWTNLDTTLVSAKAFRLALSSPFVVQNEPTTSQLTGVALTFVPGIIMIDSPYLKHYDLATLNHTEFEWAITATENAAPNTTYYFREWGSTANNLDIGMTYPSLTTSGVLAVKFTGFSVSREGKKIKVEWSTASELNNDRFEILRSSDGKTWKTISSIKAANSGSSSNKYTAYDERPLSGINYYIIKQYDTDGKSTQSNVKFIKMPDANPIVSVFPNPSHSGIKFSIENRGASDLDAVLSNVNGGIIHHETFKNVPANAINKLNLVRQPAPGVYILKLKGDGISETVRIIIE